MFRTITTLVALCSIALSVSAQQVEEVQKTLIIKKTATWCPYCGTWGWDFFDDVRQDNAGKAVFWAAHYGGSMLENPTSTEIVSNLSGGGQPKFYLNTELQNVSSGNTASARITFQNAVDTAYLQAPVANVGIDATYEGDLLTVHSKSRFFQDADGEYYLGLYLVENDLLAYQAGQNTEVMHSSVLRKALTPTTYGTLLADGPVAAGTEFEHEYTVSFAGTPVTSLEVAGVIWKKTGAQYTVVNVWSTTDINEMVPTSTADIEQGAHSWTLSPNPAHIPARIELQLEQTSQIQLLLVDRLGRTLDVIHSGWLNPGPHLFTLPALPAGLYQVVLQTETGRETKQLAVF